MRLTKSPKEGFPLPQTMTHQPDGPVVSVPEDYSWTNTHTHMNLSTTPQHKRDKTAEATTRGRQSKESNQIKAKLFNADSLDLCHDLILLLTFNMTQVKFKKWPRRKGIFLNTAFFLFIQSIHQLPLLPLKG